MKIDKLINTAMSNILRKIWMVRKTGAKYQALFNLTNLVYFLNNQVR